MKYFVHTLKEDIKIKKFIYDLIKYCTAGAIAGYTFAMLKIIILIYFPPIP